MDNFARITEEARITDPTNPNFNSDMNIIIAGTTKSYREMILAGFDPNSTDACDAFLATQR
jgi:hypothetical protein